MTVKNLAEPKPQGILYLLLSMDLGAAGEPITSFQQGNLKYKLHFKKSCFFLSSEHPSLCPSVTHLLHLSGTLLTHLFIPPPNVLLHDGSYLWGECNLVGETDLVSIHEIWPPHTQCGPKLSEAEMGLWSWPILYYLSTLSSPATSTPPPGWFGEVLD